MERNLFYRKGEPDTVGVPASEMVGKILSPTQDVVIKNGHSSMSIPNITLRDINFLDFQEKRKIRIMLFNALQDASRVTLTSKK